MNLQDIGYAQSLNGSYERDEIKRLRRMLDEARALIDKESPENGHLPLPDRIRIILDRLSDARKSQSTNLRIRIQNTPRLTVTVEEVVL